MDTQMIIGLIAVVVVGFFAFQWWSYKQRSSAAAAATRKSVASMKGSITTLAPTITTPVKEESLPVVAGQTEGDLKAKEPLQQRVALPPVVPPSAPAQAADGLGPAQFASNLRHPEQAFHQPQGETATPTMNISDVGAMRAGTASTPLDGNQQPFSPEFAQNGSALLGNSVFAYDGMEPTGFSSF